MHLESFHITAPEAAFSAAKTSVVVALDNTPGSLFKALGCFALRDINITKMETRPTARVKSMFSSTIQWEMVIFIDFEVLANYSYPSMKDI